MATACPSARIAVGDFARLLKEQFPNLNERRLKGFVRRELNSRYDRGPSGESSYDSISRAEASWFVLETEAAKQWGKADPFRLGVSWRLQQFFFQGRNDWHLPPAPRKFPARITDCADGDTCRAVIQETNDCRPLMEILRFSAVDTPESFPSEKLERVTSEVLLKLQSAFPFPDSWTEQLRPLVRFRVQYLGDIAKLIMKDFQSWLQVEGGSFAVGNSYDFSGGKYHGLWQGYGNFLRRIVSLHATPEMIPIYFRTRLPKLMATTGAAFYKESRFAYREALKQAAEKLGADESALYFLGDQTLLNPASIFSAEQGSQLSARWGMEVMPTAYADDWTGALVFLGIAYYYPKYNNQHGETYARIHLGAQANRVGLWQDPIFQLMNPGPSL